MFGGELKKLFVQNRNFFFQNVELGELITNHPTCNYPSCTVSEIFGLVTSKCMFFGGGLTKIFRGGAHQKKFHQFTIIPVYDDVIHLYMYDLIHIYI